MHPHLQIGLELKLNFIESKSFVRWRKVLIVWKMKMRIVKFCISEEICAWNRDEGLRCRATSLDVADVKIVKLMDTWFTGCLKNHNIVWIFQQLPFKYNWIFNDISSGFVVLLLLYTEFYEIYVSVHFSRRNWLDKNWIRLLNTQFKLT